MQRRLAQLMDSVGGAARQAVRGRMPVVGVVLGLRQHVQHCMCLLSLYDAFDN